MIGLRAYSSEIVEAAFALSENISQYITLEFSRDEVASTLEGSAWITTSGLLDLIKQLRVKYPNSKVNLLRTHLGPSSVNKKELGQVFSTLESDNKLSISNFHFDFSRIKGNNELVDLKQLEAIKFIKRLNPDAEIQLGYINPSRSQTTRTLTNSLNIFNEFKPDYFIVPSGSEIKEDFQFGVLNYEQATQFKSLLRDRNILIREIDLDYSSAAQIALRKGLMDWISIGPELGQVQGDLIIKLAREKELKSLDPWLNEAYDTKHWKGLLYTSDPSDFSQCSALSSYKVFNTKAYERVYRELSQEYDLRAEIMKAIEQVFERYYLSYVF